MLHPFFNFCPKFWNEIHIIPTGDVYNCCSVSHCFSERLKLGNIKEQSLLEIWRGTPARQIRNMALKGNVPCFGNCRQLDKTDLNYSPSYCGDFILPNPLVEDYSCLKKLRVIFSCVCNIACVMCKQDKRSKTHLPLQVLLDHVDVAPFEQFILQGGEPFVIADCLAYFDYLVERGKRPSFNTNGLLLNEKWLQKIAKHSTHIIISLNAASKAMHENINRGSNWERVLENVGRLKRIKKASGSDLAIIGHMTIVSENANEIATFIRKAEGFGFDEIEFSVDYEMYRRDIRCFKDEVMLALGDCKILVRKYFLKELGLVPW